MNEQPGQSETLSPSEQGKLAYETAEELASQLAQLPEFKEELVRTFFSRREWSGVNIPWPAVGQWHALRFLKGSYEYSICYSSNGGHEHEGINSIDMKLSKSDSENPRHLFIDIHINSTFHETPQRAKKFDYGTINLKCYGRDVQNPGVITGREAAKMIPKFFREILSKPIEL